jgi:signal transduction histidine kinase
MTLHLKSVEAASRAKDEFVAMLGHELRNPLGAITTAIHLLNARGDSDNNARLRGIITRQTRHLSRLVEDLLDVSKLVSGKIILHRQTEDLREVAEMALASFHEAGKATRHVISLTGDPVRVHGDSTRLAQIVSNLLDNAVKYTPSGGRVELTILAAGPERFSRFGTRGWESLKMSFLRSSTYSCRRISPSNVQRGPRRRPDDRQAAGRATRRDGVGIERRSESRQRVRRAVATGLGSGRGPTIDQC